MTFQNTEQIISFSGVTGTFMRNAFDQVTKNSGGHVFIPGPVILNAVIPIAAAAPQTTLSGTYLAVIHGVSGMQVLSSGDQIFYKNYGAHSGTTEETPSALMGLATLCRSGLNVVVSGGGFYLTVIYASRAT